jgi:hypothetical protein
MPRVLPLIRLTLAATILISISALVPPAAVAQTRSPDYQRYVTFHNDFGFQIYPVIQVPADICDGSQFTDVRRIMVNGVGHAGLQPQETLTVLIPNEKQDVTVQGVTVVRRCWYQSGRIYIFPVDVARFEAAMVALDPNNAAQTTRYHDPRHPSVSVPCFQGTRDAPRTGAEGSCFTGLAQNTFAPDAPAQLAEYTFDSDNGLANKDPDTGTPMADIDVSNVDDVYLPVAASVENGGATGYMGSALNLNTFEQRLADFQARGWPVYSAYLEQFWHDNTFSALLPPELGGAGNPPVLHLPGGYNSIQNTLSRSASSLYRAAGAEHYLISISGVLERDAQVQPYVDRWMSWIDGNPCADLDQLAWPEHVTGTFDRQLFCERFRATVQAVWDHFNSDETDGFKYHPETFLKDCGLPAGSESDTSLTNPCIVQHIVGYNSPVQGGQLPGQVQALLRGVASYDPQGGPQDDGQQYQYDPFLTFDAPFTSQFSLDPYTRLIHSTQDGVSAVAYSFSIDDKYGNFRDAASGFVVDAGGTTALRNKQPFDPYQQYKLNWGYNREPFSLAWLRPDVDVAGIEARLEALAQQNQNRPVLIRQAERLAVLGHADGAGWTLTDPLVTREQLQALAEQESGYSRGKTHVYQDVIDHTFGSASVFPAAPLDPNASDSQTVGTLYFDPPPGASPSTWAAGQEVIYGFISRQHADVPDVGNWKSAIVCGVDFPVSGPGSQRLPLSLGDGTSQACAITATDSFGQSLALTIAPAALHPVDSYTGATVSVWGLPVGPTFSGDPQITSDLSAGDLRSCQRSSSLADLCANVTLSAVWSADSLARDVVYMGLDPKAMPRVNVNLPPAPAQPPDPQRVTWPLGATMTTQAQGDGKVLVSWPAAQVGAGTPLQYLLYVRAGATWNPVPGCDQSTTSCRVTLQAPASLYVIAVNTRASPPRQTPQLFGCYPSTGTCGAASAPAAASAPTPGDSPAPASSPPATASAPGAGTPGPTTSAGPPRASDGQALADQDASVQADFLGRHGAGAAASWVAEHEAELARRAP